MSLFKLLFGTISYIDILPAVGETLTPKTASEGFGTVLLKNKELRWIAVRKGGYHTSLFPEIFILEEPGHSTLLSIFFNSTYCFLCAKGNAREPWHLLLFDDTRHSAEPLAFPFVFFVPFVKFQMNG